jgi:hypothetical protein
VPEPLNIGDRVRIMSTPATIEGAWAGREGTFYGFTTPSVTGAEVIGQTEDFALNVGFGDGISAWFDSSLVEYVRYDPEDTMSIGDRRFVRDAEGNWTPN